MAGSDKNARHSVTGGNPTQSPQPLSEAESSAVAGQLLNKLRAADADSPAVRHEARLGILVITILVFAFGFLVYHKMDLHQRSLTQASIPSAAEAKQSPQLIKPATQLEPQIPQTVANDPLLNLADLSDGSPFSGGEMTAVTESVGTESATGESETPEFSFTEPPAQSDASVAAVDAAAPKGASADTEIPAFFDEPTIELPSNEQSSTTVAAVDQAFDESNQNDFSTEAFEPVEKETLLIEAELPASGSVSAAESAGIDFPSSSESPDSDSPVTELVLPSGPSDSTAILTENVETNTEPAAEDFSEPPTQSSVESIEFADSADDTSEGREEEPMLLAMLEPQQDNGFSGDFTADEPSGPIGQAPVAEPLDPFPAINATEATGPETHESQHSKDERSSTFGIQGHDAVTQPGRQSGKNSIRTAAGSGSDGKFSLAAFNYQNNDAEPAPDDGSTFDSVVVREGDNYTTISKRVYGTVRYFSALAVFNQHRIREPKSMRPGMVVLTPPKDVLEKRYPQLFVDSQPKIVEPAEFLILSDGSPAYRVGERETLSEISARFLGRSSRWIEIYRLNQTIVKDPNKLKAGLILALPADATEVSVVP